MSELGLRMRVVGRLPELPGLHPMSWRIGWDGTAIATYVPWDPFAVIREPPRWPMEVTVATSDGRGRWRTHSLLRQRALAWIDRAPDGRWLASSGEGSARWLTDDGRPDGQVHLPDGHDALCVDGRGWVWSAGDPEPIDGPRAPCALAASSSDGELAWTPPQPDPLAGQWGVTATCISAGALWVRSEPDDLLVGVRGDGSVSVPLRRPGVELEGAFTVRGDLMAALGTSTVGSSGERRTVTGIVRWQMGEPEVEALTLHTPDGTAITSASLRSAVGHEGTLHALLGRTWLALDADVLAEALTPRR